MRISKAIASFLVAAGVAGSALAVTAQPARADGFVAVGFHFGGGGGVAYAPRYHWYNWHDGDGWHRRWVPVGWVAPVAYGPGRAYYAGPVGYAHRDWHRDYDWRRDHDWHRDHDGHRDHDRH